MNNTIYSSLPVVNGTAPNTEQEAILVREAPDLQVQEFIDRSELLGSSTVRKTLRIFPVVGFLSIAAMTVSYAAAYMSYGYRQDDVMDRALTAAKWSQMCLLGNLGMAIGVRSLSKISGKWTSETKNLVLNTVAASFPCFFARVVCCELEPDSETVVVYRERPTP